MTTYLGRDEWTSTDASGNTLTGAELVGVAVHWPGTTQQVIGVESQAQTASRLRGYRTFHVTGRGWRDFGYNVAIDQAGRVWMGRSDTWGVNLVGAHCASPANPRANHKYVGVLLIIGAGEAPSAAMREAFADWFHTRFLPRWPMRADVRGHGQVPGASTSCPGSRARADIADGSLITTTDGGGMSWNEDLSPGTPGNDITNLADTTIPDSWGRYAADLLGYAAAHWAWARNSDGLVEKVWRTDHVLRSPSKRPNQDGNPHLFAETFLREIWNMLHTLLELHSGEDGAAILARLDSIHASLEAQLDAAGAERADILALVEAVGSGERDAAEIVDEIARRLSGEGDT